MVLSTYRELAVELARDVAEARPGRFSWDLTLRAAQVLATLELADAIRSLNKE